MATRRISSRRRMSVNDVRTRLMQIHGGPPPGPQLAPVAAASRAQVAAEGWGRLGVLSPGAANAGAFFRRVCYWSSTGSCAPKESSPKRRQ